MEETNKYLENPNLQAYLYEIEFKGKHHRIVRDLTADGYYYLAHPDLECVDVELIHYGQISEESPAVCAAVKATVVMNGRSYSSVAEAVFPGDTELINLLRVAETRAKKRAFAIACRITKYDLLHLNATPFGNNALEDESGTPLKRVYGDDEAPKPFSRTPAFPEVEENKKPKRSFEKGEGW